MSQQEEMRARYRLWPQSRTINITATGAPSQRMMQLIARAINELDEYGRDTWQYEFALEIAAGIVANRCFERNPRLRQLREAP